MASSSKNTELVEVWDGVGSTGASASSAMGVNVGSGRDFECGKTSSARASLRDSVRDYNAY